MPSESSVVGILRNRFERGLERIDSGGGWSETKHDGGAGRVTYGCLAMGIGKQSSPCRQFVQIGRFDLWMATQATDPIIQIINGQKQNIGLGLCIDR